MSTIDSKLRNFQYKYLMRLVTTNKLLLKYKLKMSNLCEFCNMHVETLKHLFWECIHTQHYWREITHFLNSKHLDTNLNYELISFGYTDVQKNAKTILKNYIIFRAKYFIFINKCRNTIPTAIHFTNYLNKEIEIEKCIALNKDKLESHESKWRLFTT